MNNRLHKVIFNRNTGLMAVVAENSHNNGKSSATDNGIAVSLCGLFNQSDCIKIAATNSAKAAYAMRDLSSQVGNIVQNKNTGNNKLTVTIGTKHQENQATNHTEIAHKTILYTKQGSEFTVATDKNDITLHGFDMQGIENGKSAGRLILNPARDLISKSVDLHDSQNEKGKHYSIEAGIFVGQSDGASGFGVTGEVAYGENSSKLERTTHDENRINAERVTFNVGRNADLTGTIAKADRIDGSIKGNLKLASEQDIETYRQKSIDGTVSASVAIYGSGAGSSGSLSYSETKADLKTVNEQTGLFAGKNGIDLTVGGNTHLDGALIASEADKDKNHFSTGTLTWNNIANEKSFESTSGSVTASVGSGGMSFMPTLSHFEDEEHGTTNAAIFANGTVEVRNGNLNGISRDTANANKGSLTPIDYQKYAENQEVSQLIGEVGASTITTLNDYGIIDKNGKSGAIARGTVAALQTANNGGGTAAIATNALAPVVSYEIGQYYKGENAEGSLGHIAAHAGLGAVTAYANGGNAAAGAASAALGEYTAQVVTEKLYGTDKAYLLGEKEQQTIIGLSKFAGAVSGAFVGDSSLDTIIGSNIAETAVENNQVRPPRRGGIQSFRNEQMRANYKMQLGRVRQYIKGFNGFDSIRPLDETGRAIYSQSEIDQLARFADFVIANQNRGWTQQDFVRNFNQRGYNSPAPENLSPPNSGRQGAINAAKRNELIPTSMLPTRTEKNTYPSNGQTYTGNVYYYTFYNLNGGIQREYRIRDDVGGHYQGIGNPQNRGPHFNIERNTLRKDERGNYIFEDLGKHYDY